MALCADNNNKKKKMGENANWLLIMHHTLLKLLKNN